MYPLQISYEVDYSPNCAHIFMIIFVHNLPRVDDFLQIVHFSPPMKLIASILLILLLKVTLNILHLLSIPYYCVLLCWYFKSVPYHRQATLVSQYYVIHNKNVFLASTVRTQTYDEKYGRRLTLRRLQTLIFNIQTKGQNYDTISSNF